MDAESTLTEEAIFDDSLPVTLVPLVGSPKIGPAVMLVSLA
jgi:hypothetical protein